MAYIILIILGGSVGSQFGAAGGLIGVLIGLALAGSVSGSPEAASSCSEQFQDLTWLTQNDDIGTTGISSLQDDYVFLDDSFPDDNASYITTNHHPISEPTWTNPATGLPMTGEGISGLDVGSNVFGSSNNDLMSSTFDTTTDSLFDDNFGTGGIDNDW
jgi:hypothetical protein